MVKAWILPCSFPFILLLLVHASGRICNYTHFTKPSRGKKVTAVTSFDMTTVIFGLILFIPIEKHLGGPDG